MPQATLAWIIPVSGGGDEGLHPSHPIVIPPGAPPYPDQGLPPFPSHPIYTPPGTPPSGGGGAPGGGLGFWGGGPHPVQPIAPPPEGGDTVPIDPGYFPPGVAVPVPPPSGEKPTQAYVVAYAPGYGRVTFLVDLPTSEPPTEATPK